ncbi:protein kinase domain-containing protein [Hyalangium rubrum]|uniref:Protein kinase n=1 Tax=Hyalangium rubrum TaxID=3103134 RepID=A0ABU5HHN3_9BACT|nr:protein kinase [Hyalangium sp. s54d21]MDY7232644.1 protein kinase [Hyalangium sp. s54d21]
MGPYRLSARIATGGMAEVYLARRIDEDGRRGPSVAVKRLLPHLINDRRIVQMFLNEARITAQVRHPHVVSILELGMAESEPFIAMELLEGRSFAEVRQEAAERARRVPLGVTLRVLVDACRGLDAAHRAVDEAGRPLRIVHRDFTPDNIHVGVNGSIKVIDFGIAKAESLGSGTEPGTLKGKFFYMSPEMIVGQTVDHRADIFAAGVMLYEQLCGRRPFTGLNPEEVLSRIAEGRPRPPTDFDPSVPLALEHICLTALHRQPSARFETLQMFIDAIESVGGPAEVATPEQVAAYVESLFPLDRDPKRQALQRARSADPSDSGSEPIRPLVDLARIAAAQAASSATVSVPPPPAPLAPVASAPPSLPPEPATRPATPSAKARTPSTEARSRGPGRALLLAGVLLLALGAGVTFLLLRPSMPPAERLTTAEASSTREARTSALKGLGEDPRSTAQELARAGALLMDVGAHDAALELAEAFTRRFPREVESHLLAARAATETRMGKRAERAIEEASALAPGDVRPMLALAELRERQGDVSGAAAALSKAYEKRPKDTRIAPRYGRLLSLSGKLDEAAEVLGAWTKDNNDAEALAELAFVRYRQERMDDAAALLKRALRKAPKLAVAHYYLGAVLFHQGDSTGAERAYREADQLAPQDPRALAARCQLHARKGNAAAVAEIRRELASRFPDRSEALAAECQARD